MVWHLILHFITGRTWFFLPVTLYALTAGTSAAHAGGSLDSPSDRSRSRLLRANLKMDGYPCGNGGTALTAEGRILQIDDGCSGIRSFQSLLMISVFFGEFFLGFPQWILMVLTGFLSAFIFNGLRTLTLTWIFFERGEAPFHEFHDGVGMVTFALSAVATYFVAWKMAGQLPCNGCP